MTSLELANLICKTLSSRKAYDIVKIDVGATYKGFTGDSAATFGVGEISPEVITNFTLEYPVIAFEIEFITKNMV